MISSLPEAAVAAELFAVLAPLDHRARERALTWLAVALEVDLSDVDPQMAFEAAQAVGLIENAP